MDLFLSVWSILDFFCHLALVLETERGMGAVSDISEDQVYIVRVFDFIQPLLDVGLPVLHLVRIL